MPKNGVQQMTKRPMTTATVVAMRKSWNESNMVKLWLIIKSLKQTKHGVKRTSISMVKTTNNLLIYAKIQINQKMNKKY